MTTNLHFVYLPDPSVAWSAAGFLPRTSGTDVSLLVRNTAAGADTIEYKIHVLGTEEQYNAKKSSNTVFATGKDLDNLSIGIVEQAAGNPTFYFYKPQVDPGPVVNEVLNAVLNSTTDAEADKENIEKIMSIFTNGGKYRGTQVMPDGTYTGVGERTYVPGEAIGVAPPGEITFAATDPSDIIRLIDKVMPAIVYDGFNPTKIRNAFIAKHTDRMVRARDLSLAFGAYTSIGNNIGKLGVRRVDLNTSKDLMAAVNSMGIKKSDRSSDGLTLPRLAIAFMPEYLIFRRFLAGALQSQTDSSINVVFKDIAFYGCTTIREMPGYAEFHKEFSSYIYKPGEDTDIADEKFKKNYDRWNKVSRAGYQSDTAIHRRMSTAISTTTFSKRNAFDFIVQGVSSTYSAS